MSPANILLARMKPKNLEPKNSIGAKWIRLIEKLDLEQLVKKQRVAVKMHLGGGFGFTTVHPYFVRKLIEAIKAAGAADVFVTDTPGSVASASERGYCAETIGCRLVSTTGASDKYFRTVPIDPPFLTLTQVELAGEIVDADVLIDLSHVKGHGDCGFGAAAKNLSMGCVTPKTRGRLHALEGGLDWSRDKCTNCDVCRENCPNGAISFGDNKEFHVFYHNCKFCQHCVLICPNKAISMTGGQYRDFQKGLAIATDKVLETFAPDRVLFINFLMDITMFCDCWGMTSPTLVPDIGIIAGRDIVAVEQATLDLIDEKKIIPDCLPDGWELRPGTHLFEKVHGKDPFPIVEYLAQMGRGVREYRITEVE